MEQNWSHFFAKQQGEMIAHLRTYVEMETPTHDKQAVDALGRLIATQFAALGCQVTVLPQEHCGDQLRIEYGHGEEQLFILGHFDTVKEVGTLIKEPWRIDDGKIYGPGVYDMKAGIVFCYYALKTIIEQKLPLRKKLVFFWNTDEETGSVYSEAFIKAEAQKSVLALVIEPATSEGALKTSRKGGGEFSLRVRGRAAHAGSHHSHGINAIEEIAHQIIQIQSWTDYEVGTTLSVGVIRGGSASNVVPDLAEVEIDFRVSQESEAERLIARMQSLTPVLPGAELEVTVNTNKPPMERTAATEQLFIHARAQAALEGLTLTEVAVGGTSDGNFAAAAGIPVLDGLGPVGDGAHATYEHIVVDDIPARTALLLRLFTTL